ncbi:DUF3592 domain-containing protein [uncultured Ruminococcus sp.]|uniref:DUF3592 domain-containing protein n=1 Tax=uncultured Ruminococcus sp. TaxID=165186 RepID=UPI0025D3D6D0|nr:DUF3592 domain-containing protein [uncultured Ruminococcus sp.]
MAANSDNGKTLYTLIFCGIMAAAAVFLVYLGISSLRLQKACTCEVTAEFMGYSKDVRSSGTGSRSVWYYPTFRYGYGGNVYETEVAHNTYHRDMEVGDEVKIYIDPDSPESIIDPADKTVKAFMIIEFTAAVLMTAEAVWLLTDLRSGQQGKC